MQEMNSCFEDSSLYVFSEFLRFLLTWSFRDTILGTNKQQCDFSSCEN